MEKSFWIHILKRQLSDNKTIYKYMTKYNIQLYLFGSARVSKKPNDLDILLIYPDISKVTETLELKKELISYLQELNCKDIHMVLMTVQENDEINFVKKEGAIRFNICRKGE